MKVLVAEDTPQKYVEIERKLKEYKISMICRALTLEDAKNKIEQSCKENELFDLIVTDMQFPDKKGMSVLQDAGFQLIDFVNSLSLNIPMIICSTGRYPATRENLLGSLYYSESSDWERELKKLLSTIPSPPKQ